MLNPSRDALAVDHDDDQDQENLQRIFEETRSMLEAGRADQALVPLRDILSRYPDHPHALNFASVAFGQLNMTEEAERFSREAIAKRPDDAGFHLNLANRLKELGRTHEALDYCRRALELDPGHPQALKSRLRYLTAQRRWPEARKAVDQALAHIDDDAEFLAECANACIGADDKARATDLFQEALAIDPDRVPWLLQLARLAVIQNQFDLARTTGERVLEFEDHPEMHAMLASIMHRRGDLDAVAEHLDAIREDSDQEANAANLRGMMLASQGRTREALDHMARTDTLSPDVFVLQATRIMYLNYDPDISTVALRDAHLAVGQRFANAVPLLDQDDIARPHDPDRRLRVGFVSPDFCCHSVAYFISSYFDHFDRDQFDVFAYAYVPEEDGVSRRLREQVTCWRNIFGISNQALAGQIRDDRIDILIDLAGYTRDSRLEAFTARPAPIQMTYIGYPNTTGLPAIDFRITDAIADPEGADEHYSETLIRMPDCFLCYAVPSHAPPVEPGPQEHRGYITFGSFNNFAKINPSVISLWAEVLRAVPESRLLCKSSSSSDVTAQQVIRQGLEQAGIDPKRVSFSAYRKTQEGHLAVYNDVDIALDSFPYNGTTTTCEALWMGVPVVTLRGDRHVGRVGASILTTVGFPAGIAESRDDYVLTARLLAESPGLLRTVRNTLRDTVMRSPLCDGRDHAATLEQAFRYVWQTWCEEKNR